MSWPIVRITEVARVVGGATPKTDINEYWGGDISWATPKDLSNLGQKLIAQTDRQITANGLKSCAAEVLPKGSVLFSSRAPIGHVAINDIPMATNQGFKSFIPNERLDASFLYWWLDANRARLQAMGTGATFKEVSKATVEKIEIPLPPLKEQKRIAGILDQADALRRLRARALEKLNSLGQAVFQEMFGTTVSATPDDGAVHLSEVVNIESGFAFSSPLFGEVGLPVIRISNLQNGEVEIENCAKILPEKIGKGAKYNVRSGDILIAMSGATIGKAARVPRLENEAYLNQRVGGYKFDASRLLPSFLWELVTSKAYLDLALSGAWGAAQPNVSSKQLVDLFINLPPMATQKLYEKQSTTIELNKRHALMALRKVENLFASLQSAAFQGKL